MIDTHAHIDHLENPQAALERALEAGVGDIIAVSMNLPSCRKNLEIKNAVRQPQLHLAFGEHPSDVNPDETGECLEFIKANREHLTAIGEIGLDFWYKWVRKDKEKHQQQREAFRKYLELARELDLPVVIHSRGTWKECLETTQGIGIQRAVFHWYSGPVDVLKKILEAGYYVSTTPSLAYSPQSREAIGYAPIEQTLIETDCPVSYKDGETAFQAEPKDVFRTLKIYSEFKKVAEEKAAEILNGNARRLFGI
jgi:TatD DNase family protein